MNLRIIRVHRVADGGVTARALGGHIHPVGVISTGVVINKAAMAGGAVAWVSTGSAPLTSRRASEDASCPMALTAGIMNLVVRATQRNTAHTPRRASMTISAVRVQSNSVGVIGAVV